MGESESVWWYSLSDVFFSLFRFIPLLFGRIESTLHNVYGCMTHPCMMPSRRLLLSLRHVLVLASVVQ